MYLAPSSSGLGRRLLKAVAPVQIRSGLLDLLAITGEQQHFLACHGRYDSKIGSKMLFQSCT